MLVEPGGGRAEPGSCFSRMGTNSSRTTPQALWEAVGVQTETQMDRETTCGRPRVNSELPPAESKGIKLVTEIHIDASRCPKYFMQFSHLILSKSPRGAQCHHRLPIFQTGRLRWNCDLNPGSWATSQLVEFGLSREGWRSGEGRLELLARRTRRTRSAELTLGVGRASPGVWTGPRGAGGRGPAGVREGAPPTK